jgi:hypothetical protein
VTGRRRATGDRHQPGGEAADTDARLVDDPNDFLERLTVRVALHPDQYADGDIDHPPRRFVPAITPR